MSSDAVVKCVAKKLKYYFDVKRLEDGFDLSGVNSPQLDHPPLKSRPTLQYDGLHDRALKHYFSLPEVRVKLTQMGPGESEPRQKIVKKKIKRQMVRHNFLLTRDQDPDPISIIYGPPRYTGMSKVQRSPSPLPDYMYSETREGRRLRREMTGQGILLRSQRPRSLKGGWPLLRTVPNHNISRAEARRLVDRASKLLIATEAVDNDNQLTEQHTKRPQSAPQPFETVRSLPHHTSDSESGKEICDEIPTVYIKKWSVIQPMDMASAPVQKVNSSKYTWDIHGRRHRTLKAHSSENVTDYRSESPAPTPAPPPESPEPEPEPKKVRPKSAKRRTRQKTVIEVKSTKQKQDVSVNSGTQTNEKLLQEYDYLEEEVTSGEWAEYQIYVRTGNRIGASTKADVKITLYGEKGRTKEITLDKSKRHKVCFQKGKEDLFIIPHHHVGKLMKIKIGHDRADASNAWFLEGVTVYDMHSKKIFEFVCERWLSGVDGDHKTYRELLVDRDRAFIQALEEGSDTESHSVGKRKTVSTESLDSHHSDRLSMKAQGSNADLESSKVKVHSSKHYDDSESDSELSDSSSSSSTSETVTQTTTATSELTPVVRRRDDFFDDTKTSGPTYTFRTIKEAEVESDSTPQKTASSEDGKDFLQGYQTGLEAVEREKRQLRDQENEERRRLLRGPSIHEAATRGDLNRIQELFNHFPEMKDHTDEQGFTPLHLAAKYGRIDIVKWLAVNDVDLNRDTPQGYSAIHLAAMQGHVSCLMVLHAMGAVITCRTMDKKTPLHLAAMNGHLECVKWLVANRCGLAVKEDMGRTPREIAEEFQHSEVAKFLRACEEEMENPRSGFAQLRNTDPNQHLPTIQEDSNSDERPVWRDDKSPSDQRNAEKKTSQKEKEEKRRIYEEQHKKMEKSGDSFLESIQHEFEGGPGP